MQKVIKKFYNRSSRNYKKKQNKVKTAKKRFVQLKQKQEQDLRY